MTHILRISLIFFVLALPTGSVWGKEKGWEISTSLPDEALCFLQAIGPEPMYSRFYAKEQAAWRPKLSGRSLEWIDRMPVSASRLCFLASRSGASSYEDLLSFFSGPAAFLGGRNPGLSSGEREALKQEVSDWGKDLAAVLEEMRQKGFLAYWQKEIRPLAEEGVRRIESRLAPYDAARIIREVEAFLGEERVRGPKRFRVRLVHFARPLCFALGQPGEMVASLVPDTARKDRQMVTSALHELLHRFPRPPEVDRFTGDLRHRDAFFRECRAILREWWREGDEEPLVAAAEAYLARKLRLRDENETLQYLLSHNGGTLTFAAVLYRALQERKFRAPYGRFLADLFRQGSLLPGSLETAYHEALRKLLGRISHSKWTQARLKEIEAKKPEALDALERWVACIKDGDFAAAYALCTRRVQRRLAQPHDIDLLEGDRTALGSLQSCEIVRTGYYFSPQGPLFAFTCRLRYEKQAFTRTLLVLQEGKEWRLDPIAVD